MTAKARGLVLARRLSSFVVGSGSGEEILGVLELLESRACWPSSGFSIAN